MGDPAKRRAIYEDLLAVPEHLVAEIINGNLVTSPRPGVPHARSAGRLGVKLGGPFDLGEGGPGGWVLLPEPELHLGDGDVIVPDMAGWRRERMPVVPDTAAIELTPDWVCEVLSPHSTETRDRGEKMPIYAREGAGYLWLINPITQTLEAYRLERERWMVLGTWSRNSKVCIPPFEAVELDLALLWAR